MKLPKMAAYASHTALQLITGARKEGFSVTLFGPENRLRFYRKFGTFGLELLQCDDGDCVEKLEGLTDHVLIPNGSLIEYVKPERFMGLKLPIFGSREILKWESSWRLKVKLMEAAGLPIPKSFTHPDEVDRLVIVKLPGAKGGRGYLVSSSGKEIATELRKLVSTKVIGNESDAYIQEYVIGVPVYAHYFMSPMMGRLELTGFDIRYETNVDGLRRIYGLLPEERPTFVVAGNIPLYLRESLIESYLEYGEKFVEATRRLLSRPIVGPFCLESVVRDDLTPVFFEFSGRIVAGTNVYMDGSPYLELYWGEKMSVGRRIAREIRMAVEQERLEEVVT